MNPSVIDGRKTEHQRLRVTEQALLWLTIAESLVLSGCSTNPAKARPTQYSSLVTDAVSAVALRPVQAFGFVHQETTGITSFVRLNGKDVPIQFRSDSDTAAVMSLRSLQPEVFLPNADGTTIRVVGQYYDALCRTPDAPNRAKSEEYHEFRLDRWYILTPFTEDSDDCQDGQDSCPRTRHRLTNDDFVLMTLSSADLKRLQRSESSKQSQASPSPDTGSKIRDGKHKHEPSAAPKPARNESRTVPAVTG